MLRGWHGEHRITPECGVIDERPVIATRQGFSHVRLETQRPVVRRLMPPPGEGLQVVHDVAAAEHQDPFFTQRSQACAELVMEAGRLRLIEAQLHHRHVRLRVEVAEHGPGSVVQAPLTIGGHGQWREQLLHTGGQRRIARGGVAHREQLAREAAEVVNGARRIHGRHGATFDVPVSRDREHRTRARQRCAECCPATRPVVRVERVHRAAVPEEQCRQSRACLRHARPLRHVRLARRASRAAAPPTGRAGHAAPGVRSRG